MAKDLNKARVRDSKIVVVAAILAAFFTKALIPTETMMHESVELIGLFLLAICAIGRVYTSAFLGGHKNKNLIDFGPFSVVRNPLYVFSIIGMTGVALVSTHLLLIVFMPLFFIVLYHYLVGREEAFLREEFGAAYQSYTQRVPRFVPNFKLYQAPEFIESSPRFLLKAVADAVWWFVAFPLFELAEWIQEMGLVKPLFLLP